HVPSPPPYTTLFPSSGPGPTRFRRGLTERRLFQDLDVGRWLPGRVHHHERRQHHTVGLERRVRPSFRYHRRVVLGRTAHPERQRSEEHTSELQSPDH